MIDFEETRTEALLLIRKELEDVKKQCEELKVELQICRKVCNSYIKSKTIYEVPLPEDVL